MVNCKKAIEQVSEDRLAMIAVVAAGGPVGSDLAAQKEFVRTCQTYHPPGPGRLAVRQSKGTVDRFDQQECGQTKAALISSKEE